MIEYMIYIVLAAWSSLITWFITKKKIKQEQFEVEKIEHESTFLKKQSAAVEELYNQNAKINQLMFKFQEDVIKLHDEVLKSRIENTSLRFEICRLNDTIKLLTIVNNAEDSFKE